ncbi:MAG: hypothetical protein ACUVQY_01940 [Thermoproteota archaeon]
MRQYNGTRVFNLNVESGFSNLKGPSEVDLKPNHAESRRTV